MTGGQTVRVHIAEIVFTMWAPETSASSTLVLLQVKCRHEITVSNDFTALVAYPTELHRQNCLPSCLQADIARKKCPQKVPLTYNRQRGRTVHIRTRPGPLPEISARGSSF